MWKPVTLATKTEKITFPYTRSLRLTVGNLSTPAKHPAWGIDPGVNFGLTVAYGNDVHVYHGVLSKGVRPGEYGLLSYMFLGAMIRKYHHINAHLTIEGAAYGAPYRQVELSEIRTGFYLAGINSGRFNAVGIVPPKSVRKRVFGNGTVQAGDEFPLLNHNAADSLAMALYSVG